MRSVVVGMLAAGLALVAPMGAQDAAQQSANRDAGTNPGAKANPDHNFAMKAAYGGMAEVKLGELAKEKASNPDVKAFGQQMVDDHSKANDEMKGLASSKGITLPNDMDARDKATYARLEKLNGAEFDRAYMKDMVSDHHADVNEFRRESDHGSDPDVKAWAAKTLPTLEHHLQMAESIDAKLKK